MKLWFVFLSYLFSTVCVANEIEIKPSIFEIMDNYSAHCNECALHKMLISMISNLSKICLKSEDYENKILTVLKSINFPEDNLDALSNFEIQSIIDLTNELAKMNNISFEEIIISQFKQIMKDIDLDTLLKGLVISLAQESNTCYEYACIHIKNNYIWHLGDMFKFIITASKTLQKNHNKPYGLIIFQTLLLQLNK